MTTGTPKILLIAGSDPSGGLEADQKVAAVHGVYAMTATTALTAQNTQRVEDIHHVPAAFLQRQLTTVLADIQPDVVKTGMLSSKESIAVITEILATKRLEVVVVDPVMVASSGAILVPQDALSTIIDKLLPLATILTPNVPEAELILRHAYPDLTSKPSTLQELIELARGIVNLGPKFVLLKGGHLPLLKPGSDPWKKELYIYNILVSSDSRDEPIIIESRYRTSKNTHGTGCSLASAIACNLARKLDVEQAIRNAIQFVDVGIEKAKNLGQGNGPINHFHTLRFLPFSKGGFVNYILSQPDVKQAWQQYTEHEFVRKLGDASLSGERFRNYLIQDYLFLVHFSRVNALAAYKSKAVEDIQRSANTILHIHQETRLHLKYCETFGLSKEDIVNQEEKQACTAYTRYVIDVGHSEDWLALQIAVLPCFLGYAEIAKRLHTDPKTVRENNPYMTWIENYVAPDYVAAVKQQLDLVEEHAAEQSPKRIGELIKIFVHATKMERGFWDMGLDE